jgi:hypothetical protein
LRCDAQVVRHAPFRSNHLQLYRYADGRLANNGASRLCLVAATTLSFALFADSGVLNAAALLLGAMIIAAT